MECRRIPKFVTILKESCITATLTNYEGTENDNEFLKNTLPIAEHVFVEASPLNQNVATSLYKVAKCLTEEMEAKMTLRISARELEKVGLDEWQRFTTDGWKSSSQCPRKSCLELFHFFKAQLRDNDPNPNYLPYFDELVVDSPSDLLNKLQRNTALAERLKYLQMHMVCLTKYGFNNMNANDWNAEEKIQDDFGVWMRHPEEDEV